MAASSQQSSPKGKITVQGTVLDKDNVPVPSAVVFIKGTKTGVAADLDGRFRLVMNKPGAIEVVAMGYKNYIQEIKGGGQTIAILL